MAGNDVRYYFDGLAAPGRSLLEYPDASLWPIRALFSVTGAVPEAFAWAFLLANSVLSGLFLWYLTRQGVAGARFWAWFNLALCPLILTRLDLAVGLAVALFVILCGTRWAVWAPVVLSYATMMKLSPGVLAVSLVGRWRATGTWLRVAVFVLGLVGFGAVTALGAGPQRLVTPLDYQSDRGLQVESIVATPLVLGAALFPDTWRIHYASSKSFEILGPGADVGVQVTNVLLAATVIFALVVAVRHLFLPAKFPGWNQEFVLFISLALGMLLIVSNKVFSPQYLMWVAPLVALVLLRGARPRFARVFLVATVLSAVIYPWAYLILVEGPALWVAVVLVVRNCLVAGLCVYTVMLGVRQLRGTEARSTRSPQPARPGPRR